MKTFASISFRFPAEVVRSHVPTSLARLLTRTRNGKTPEETWRWGATCYVEIPEAVLPEIVAWGRHELEGDWGYYKRGSIIRVLTVEDRYDLEDLKAAELVQVLLSDEVDDTSPVRNWKSVYRAQWDCSHCNRLSYEQTGPLEVYPGKKLGTQFSDTHAWLLLREAMTALDGCDVELKELKNASPFVQVDPRQQCRVRVDDPAFELGPPCQGCGKPQWIIPNSVLEGPRSPGDGISVFRDPTLCVEPEYDRDAGVYQSDIGSGRFEFTPSEKPRVAGEPFRIGSYLLAAKIPHTWTFARADVMERLLSMNLRGLAFRPVRIGAGCGVT